MSKFGSLTPMEIKPLFGDVTIQTVYRFLDDNNILCDKKSNSNRKTIPPQEVRKILDIKGFKYSKKNYSFQVVKGGVGKTSLSLTFGIRASHYGAKVLLADLDPQANLTSSLVNVSDDHPVWIDLMHNPQLIKDSIIHVDDHIDLLPTSLKDSIFDKSLFNSSSTANPKYFLNDILSSVRDKYDIVIFDCPPALNNVCLCASCASDEVIIPLTPTEYAIAGLNYTLTELANIKNASRLNFDFKIVWNMYDAREKLAPVHMQRVYSNEKILKHIISAIVPVDTSLKNSSYYGRSIFNMKRRGGAAENIDDITRELLGINEWIAKESALKRKRTELV